MAWRAPMSQFSWTKAFLYCSVSFIGAGILQGTLVLPSARSWLDGERLKRDQGRLVEAYRKEVDRMGTVMFEMERKIAEKDEVIKKLESKIPSGKGSRPKGQYEIQSK